MKSMLGLSLVLCLAGCGGKPSRPADAGSQDAGSQDAGSQDAGSQDAGSQDAQANDAEADDSGVRDAGLMLCPGGSPARLPYGSALAFDGDVLVIGNPEFRNTPDAPETGVAYVFRFSEGCWVQEATLFGESSCRWFGLHVAVSGTTAIVDGGCQPLRVFVKDATGWHSEGPLLTVPPNHFAGPFAFRNGTAVVALTRYGSYTATLQVFDRVDGAFTPRPSIAADIWALSTVATDGRLVVAGQLGGAAEIFLWQAGQWVVEGPLPPSPISESDDMAVSLDIDGDRVVVGNPADGVRANHAGSATLFTRDAGVWTEEAKLLPVESNDYQYFGNSVALSGNRLLVGSPVSSYAGDTIPGYATLFDRSSGNWAEVNRLRTATTGWSGFGLTVATSGTHWAVSHTRADEIGAVWVYEDPANGR